MCDKTGSMEHILSSCTTSLTQGRYRWRHESALQELTDKLERERTKKRTRQKPRMIQFVKEGQKVSKQSQPTNSILDESDKWEMSVDLKQKLVSWTLSRQHWGLSLLSGLTKTSVWLWFNLLCLRNLVVRKLMKRRKPNILIGKNSANRRDSECGSFWWKLVPEGSQHNHCWKCSVLGESREQTESTQWAHLAWQLEVHPVGCRWRERSWKPTTNS